MPRKEWSWEIFARHAYQCCAYALDPSSTIQSWRGEGGGLGYVKMVVVVAAVAAAAAAAVVVTAAAVVARALYQPSNSKLILPRHPLPPSRTCHW